MDQDRYYHRGRGPDSLGPGGHIRPQWRGGPPRYNFQPRGGWSAPRFRGPYYATAENFVDNKHGEFGPYEGKQQIWAESKAPNGQSYYYNVDSRVSSWYRPCGPLVQVIAHEKWVNNLLHIN